MGILNKKKNKKLDLLTMADPERIKLIKEVKENLRQKIVEAKLWQSFINSENLCINGEIIHSEDTPLKGLYMSDLPRST